MALLAGLLTAGAEAAHPLRDPSCAHHYSRADVTPLAERAWSRKHGPTRAQRRRYRHMRRCGWHPVRIRGRWRATKKRLKPVREGKRLSLPYPGPHGSRWAIPWRIVACESGGNFGAYNPHYEPGGPGSGPGGAYQVIRSTWHAYGGGRYADAAHHASPNAQHTIAGRIWAGGRGAGQWACK